MKRQTLLGVLWDRQTVGERKALPQPGPNAPPPPPTPTPDRITKVRGEASVVQGLTESRGESPDRPPPVPGPTPAPRTADRPRRGSAAAAVRTEKRGENPSSPPPPPQPPPREPNIHTRVRSESVHIAECQKTSSTS